MRPRFGRTHPACQNHTFSLGIASNIVSLMGVALGSIRVARPIWTNPSGMSESYVPNLSSGWVLVFLRHFRPFLLLLRVSPPIVQATTHATHEQATIRHAHLTHHSSNHNQSVSPPIIQATTSIIQATIRHTSLTHHSSNHNQSINEVIIQPFHTHTHATHESHQLTHESIRHVRIIHFP